MKAYFGLNVVNTKPYDIRGPPGDFKKEADWSSAMELIRNIFPKTNAIRMYSTTDGLYRHLMSAIPAAQKHDFSILAGVWSGGPEAVGRFDSERLALKEVVEKHGCANLAAVSVGNEDLYTASAMHVSATQMKDTAQLLVTQITAVRKVLRDAGCCDTPVTHTDTWNELVDNAYASNVSPYNVSENSS